MTLNNSSQKGTVLFLPHGGGPMPLLGDTSHDDLVAFLKKISTLINKPKAILMVSAHWEEKEVTISSGEAPDLIYDYYGFPEQAYNIKYPASGSPELVRKVFGLLKKQDIKSTLDNQRGFDHGMYVPLKIMYPEADIPCVQLSLLSSLDAKEHINIGKALSELLNDNILIIGSGFSFHNMREFKSLKSIDEKNHKFEEWLIETCTSSVFSNEEREERLINWENAPFARYCQPREEHLLPLHVCFGAGLTNAELIFSGNVIGKKTCGLRW